MHNPQRSKNFLDVVKSVPIRLPHLREIPVKRPCS